MKEQNIRWALSHKVGLARVFLGVYLWDEKSPTEGTALWTTRSRARGAQKKCRYKATRIEKVRVTVETIACKEPTDA